MTDSLQYFCVPSLYIYICVHAIFVTVAGLVYTFVTNDSFARISEIRPMCIIGRPYNSLIYSAEVVWPPRASLMSR